MKKPPAGGYSAFKHSAFIRSGKRNALGIQRG